MRILSIEEREIYEYISSLLSGLEEVMGMLDVANPSPISKVPLDHAPLAGFALSLATFNPSL
jgi:hypothetical protein